MICTSELGWNTRALKVRTSEWTLVAAYSSLWNWLICVLIVMHTTIERLKIINTRSIVFFMVYVSHSGISKIVFLFNLTNFLWSPEILRNWIYYLYIICFKYCLEKFQKNTPMLCDRNMLDHVIFTSPGDYNLCHFVFLLRNS